MTDPETLDFRTFHLLTVVHRERSFRRAAEVLGVSQSVVSYGIEKLRQVFGDPLFVRERGETLPTERCDALARYAADLLAEFEAMQVQPAFDPGTTTETLTIACNYYERSVLVPAIVGRLRAEAPGLQIEVIDAAGSGHTRLLEGEADLLIGPYQREDASFYERRLMSEHYVCLMDADHPAAKAPPSLEDYLGFDHIVVTYGGRWVSPYIREIEAIGRRLDAPLRVPSPAGIERLVKGSRLVATVPSRLAPLPGSDLAAGLAILGCPVVAPLELKLVWSLRRHHALPHRWAREVIAATVERLAGRAEAVDVLTAIAGMPAELR